MAKDGLSGDRRGSHECCHTTRGFVRALVLPNPNHSPAGLCKLGTGFLVALPGALQFGLPPGSVCSGLSSVCRAAVPEAAVDKDRDS
jgi:hypothetical protein